MSGFGDSLEDPRPTYAMAEGSPPMPSPERIIIRVFSNEFGSFTENFFENFLLPDPIPDNPPLPSLLGSHSHSKVADGEGGGEEGDSNDDIVEIEGPPPPPPEAQPGDEERGLVMQTQDMGCSGIVSLRGLYKKTQDDSSLADTKSRASKASQIRSKALVEGSDGPNDFLSATVTQNSGDQDRPSTCSSSRVQSEYGKHNGETTVIENINSADAKRNRKRRLNRESAARTRRKRQECMDNLQKELSYYESDMKTVKEKMIAERERDEAVLKELNTLKAKYPWAVEEERDKRSLTATIREVGNTSGAPSPAGSQVCGAAVGGKRARTPSMQRVASQEHLHKRACQGPSSRSELVEAVAEYFRSAMVLTDLIRRMGLDYLLK